jgi:hypothetical protein
MLARAAETDDTLSVKLICGKYTGMVGYDLLSGTFGVELAKLAVLMGSCKTFRFILDILLTRCKLDSAADWINLLKWTIQASGCN